ncbi:MAG: alpha/beta hydrolase [Chitinophagaceae bacterium]|nr:MAG: esterase/lipase [Bacteroidetes bacterium OLB11]MCC6447149.1 alpha/beta hydrolase [Chitinophagaceae bacterium]HMN32648.1 alpha/beta hydrolase [Chitinophagaceae bacterium]
MLNKFITLSLFIALFISCSPQNQQGGNNPNNPNNDVVLKNVSYGDNSKQNMDIYLPKNRNVDSTKLVVVIHGGAWSGGDKGDMNDAVTRLRKKWPQVAVANINYRLANGSSIIYNQIMQDINMAVQFLASNSAEYQISKQMGMLGASAGAHLGLLYAYQYNDSNFVKAVSDVFGPSYFADWSYYNSFNIFLGGNVKDVMKNFAGEYWNTSLYQSLSPYHVVSVANYKPTIIFHGDVDLIVPLYQSQYFNSKLDSLGVSKEYYQYPGQGHGFNDFYMNDCIEKSVSFFKTNL